MIVQYAAKPGLISMGTVQRISRPFDGVGSAPTAVELSQVWMEVALLQKTSFLDETSKRRTAGSVRVRYVIRLRAGAGSGLGRQTEIRARCLSVQLRGQ